MSMNLNAYHAKSDPSSPTIVFIHGLFDRTWNTIFIAGSSHKSSHPTGKKNAEILENLSNRLGDLDYCDRTINDIFPDDCNCPLGITIWILS